MGQTLIRSEQTDIATDTMTLTNKTLTNPTVNFTDKAPDYNVLVSAYRDGEQSNLTTGNITQVQLNAETYDLGSDFNTGTYTFTAPASGYYSVHGQVTYTNAVADKTYYAIIQVDDVDVLNSIANASLASFVTATTSGIIYVASGSTIKLMARQVSGANTVDIYGYPNYTFLDIMLLST